MDYLEFIRRRLPPVGTWVIDTCQGPGYPHFARGRADAEPEAGAFMPRQQRNSLSKVMAPIDQEDASEGGTRASLR